MAEMIEILAREMVVDLQTGVDETSGDPIFTPIEAVESIGVNPGKVDADTGHFDAAGWARHIVAERSLELTLNVVYQEDEETGDRPPGQQALQELAQKVGYTSLGVFRIYGPNGKGLKFKASASAPPIAGGGRNEAGTYSVTITVSDAPEPVTVTPGP